MTTPGQAESSASAGDRRWKQAAWFTVPPAIALGLTWALLYQAWTGPTLLVAMAVLLLAPWSVAAGNVLSFIAIADRVKNKSRVGWPRLLIGPFATLVAVALATGLLAWAAFRPVAWEIVVSNQSGREISSPRVDMDGTLAPVAGGATVLPGGEALARFSGSPRQVTVYADLGDLTAVALLPDGLVDKEIAPLLVSGPVVFVTITPTDSRVSVRPGTSVFSSTSSSVSTTQPAVTFTHTHLR